MNKKVVVITLFLTTLFAIGGVILQTHGLSVSKDFADEVWTFSASASASASGACASATPHTDAKELTGNVDENGNGNPNDANPKEYIYEGHASVFAKRKGYWTVYGVGVFKTPWYHGAANPTDNGDTFIKFRIVWGEHVFDEMTFLAGIDLSQYKIPAGAGINYTPGGPAKYYWWIPLPLDGGLRSRNAGVGGIYGLEKSSGACGDFEGTNFVVSADYTQYTETTYKE